MPLLQQILQELDTELGRLESLRKIVNSLSRTPAVVRRYTEAAPAAAPAAVADPPSAPSKSLRKSRADAGKPRGPRPRKPQPESRAVASTTPSGPVVYYPGRPKAENAAGSKGASVDEAPVVVSQPEDLDALSRSLAARWATGPV